MLSTVAISDLFPGLYKELTALKRDICDVFRRELLRRQNVVFRDIGSRRDSLRQVLHEAVVKDVVALFPYVTSTGFETIQLKFLLLQLHRPYPPGLSREGP
jgi:hypothetical protein